MSAPLISIITVTYNAAAVLQETLDSIYAVYPQDRIECILVDGNSTDGTQDIIRKQGDRIRKCISEPDAGIYDAMNKGLNLATGTYVWFLNAGDLAAAPSVIQAIDNDELRADLYYGDTRMETPEGTDLGIRRGGVPEHLTLQDLATGMKVSHQSILVRRTSALKYDIQYQYVADLDWLIRLLQAGCTVRKLPQVISVFRTGGTSGRNWRKAMLERFYCLCRHYGVLPTIFRHLLIFLRMPFTHRKHQH
jgi:glycosyltransferase involved in cell wall biosynthesis